MIITADRLREVLQYDEETGVFTWKTDISRNVKAGSIAGSTNDLGYVLIGIDGRHYYGHRLVWLYRTGFFPKWQIDHINGVRNDNRAVNLREATSSQNNINKRKREGSASDLKGAYFHRRVGKWTTNIRMQGKVMHLGYFDTPEEAHAAYAAAAEKHYGEFARLA
jgi:hypothetical protein